MKFKDELSLRGKKLRLYSKSFSLLQKDRKRQRKRERWTDRDERET